MTDRETPRKGIERHRCPTNRRPEGAPSDGTSSRAAPWPVRSRWGRIVRHRWRVRWHPDAAAPSGREPDQGSGGEHRHAARGQHRRPEAHQRHLRARGMTATQVIDMLTDESDGWYNQVIRVPVQPVDIGEYEPVPARRYRRSTRASWRRTSPTTSTKSSSTVRTGASTVSSTTTDTGTSSGPRARTGRSTPNSRTRSTCSGTSSHRGTPRIPTSSTRCTTSQPSPGCGRTQRRPTGSPTSGVFWLEMAQPWVDTIRSHADNLILMGSPSWSQSPEGALVEEFDGEDIAYTFHIYPGHNPVRVTTGKTHPTTARASPASTSRRPCSSPSLAGRRTLVSTSAGPTPATARLSSTGWNPARRFTGRPGVPTRSGAR